MSDLLNLLLAGDFFHFLTALFTSVFGAWFYAIIIGLVMATIYAKSHSPMLIWILGAILCSTFYSHLPDVAYLPIWMLLIICGAGILYEVFS